jgi:hypothetical protein
MFFYCTEIQKGNKRIRFKVDIPLCFHIINI